MATISVAPGSSLILSTPLFGRQLTANIISVPYVSEAFSSFVDVAAQEEMLKAAISRHSLSLAVLAKTYLLFFLCFSSVRASPRHPAFRSLCLVHFKQRNRAALP